MSHDAERASLAKLDSQHKGTTPAECTLWDLVRSIHSAPQLRTWATLESIPLCPFVEQRSSVDQAFEGRVHLLLVGPAKDGRFPPPWGYVAWHWPSRRLAGMLDIRGIAPESISLTAAHSATKAYAEAAQTAMDAGGAVPPPPSPLLDIYRTIIRRFSVDPDQPAKDTVVAQQPQAGQPEHPEGATVALRPLGGHGDTTTALVDRAKALIEECNQPHCLAAWRRLYARASQNGFTVAVAGEFNRGKSTLINRILGQDILPTADLPTTAMVTRVIYGPEATLWHLLPGPRRRRLSLSVESWGGLVAADDGGDPEGVAQVELPHPWLEQTGVQFVDTPGAGDLTGSRAALAIETIAHCDAVVVTVSATMPLSLTERSFVDEHVLARRIPRVAVVLTRMDQLAPQDRTRVLEFVRDKLREWAPSAELWCAHGSDVVPRLAGVGAFGPQEMLRKIEAWASDPDHQMLRKLQLLSQLDGVLNSAQGAATTQLSVVEATEGERTKAAKSAAEALSRRKLDWEDLRLEMEGRERATAQWLENAVQQAKTALVEALCFEAQHAPHPREWWEKDLPYRVRRELLMLTRSLNGILRNRIAQDGGWLYTQAKQRFSWSITATRPGESIGFDEEIADANVTPTEELADLSRMQLLTRIGIGGLTLASFLFPAARLARLVTVGGSMIGGILSERLFRGQLEEQRSRAAAAIPQVIDGILAKGIGQVLASVRGYYRILLRDVGREEALWLQAKTRAIAAGEAAQCAGQGPEQAAAIRARIQRIADLRSELGTVMKGA